MVCYLYENYSQNPLHKTSFTSSEDIQHYEYARVKESTYKFVQIFKIVQKGFQDKYFMNEKKEQSRVHYDIL